MTYQILELVLYTIGYKNIILAVATKDYVHQLNKLIVITVLEW